MTPTTAFYQPFEVAFDHFNRELFDNKLPKVIFTITRKTKCMGYFHPERFASTEGKQCHELAINPEYISQITVIDVLQTMAHEQAHCFQFCFGKPSRNGYHNKEWAELMESIGLMPSSTGQPGGKRTGQNMSDYPMEGGRFIQACETLISDEGNDSQFQLNWVDRYSKPLHETHSPLENIQELVSDETANYLLANMGDLLPDVAMIMEHSTKSFKSKYSCLECNINVWGKSELKLVCGECDSPFIQVGMDTPDDEQ